MTSCWAWKPDDWCIVGPHVAWRATHAPHWIAPQWLCSRHLDVARHADTQPLDNPHAQTA